MMGETFASRVAVSLLMDVGMGELVAKSDSEYIRAANALLSQSEQLNTGGDTWTLGKEDSSCLTRITMYFR